MPRKCQKASSEHTFLVQFSSVVSDSLWPHELQHTRPPCPSPTPGVHPNPCPLCWWCHPTISSSVVPFSSCPQSFPELESFPMSQLFASGGQSTGVSASTSVIPKNTQDWSPLGWTGWISSLVSAKKKLTFYLKNSIEKCIAIISLSPTPRPIFLLSLSSFPFFCSLLSLSILMRIPWKSNFPLLSVFLLFPFCNEVLP